MSNSNKAPRTCIITGKGMHEGYLLHTGETIADESSLLVYLKTNHKEEYVNFDSKEGMYSDDFILSDAYEQELYLWTDWYDEFCDAEEPIESGVEQITEFMYFANNFPHDWIQQVWSDNTSMCNHITSKWVGLNERNSYGGTLNFFKLYMELDGGNQAKLCEWITLNYSSKL
jgi:hypothetical protein